MSPFAIALRFHPDSIPLIAAAADNAGTNPTQVLVSYGVLGIAVVALGPFSYKAYRREANRADRLEEENRELNRIIRERLAPAGLAAVQATAQVTAAAATESAQTGHLVEDLKQLVDQLRSERKGP